MLWKSGLVLRAAQTNVDAFDAGSDSSCMFGCAGRVSRAVRHRIRPCCLCLDNANIFSLGFTEQLFCKIYQMLIRNTQ